MNPEAAFLVGAVAGVGVLHTIVPDHWVPITLLARQRGWSRQETARVAFKAGIGHVLSTLAIGLVVWAAGVAFAARFGSFVDQAASIALIAFGGWIAFAALRETAASGGHGHSHTHGHGHGHSHGFAHSAGAGRTAGDRVHGPEFKQIPTTEGVLALSIFEDAVPPRFRVTGATADFILIETVRQDGTRQAFATAWRGSYWESLEAIPEPHGFAVRVTVNHDGHAHVYSTAFEEHEHGHDHADAHGHADEHGHDVEQPADPLYVPNQGGVAVLVRHAHVHRHGDGAPHMHLHDHAADDAHQIVAATDALPPLHRHMHKTSSRTALLLILGSSPMVEGIPAFFAAGKYGLGVITLMAIVFAISTVATYVLLCVYTAAGLQRLKLGAIERYGEVLSGGLIALVGTVFWIWPLL